MTTCYMLGCKTTPAAQAAYVSRCGLRAIALQDDPILLECPLYNLARDITQLAQVVNLGEAQRPRWEASECQNWSNDLRT